MREMVDEALNILNGNSKEIIDFGKLLHESWMLKRSLTNKITNGSIDSIYETARHYGATGGKICGAGGGGFILLFVTPEKQDRVKEALKDLLFVPFRFENLGSHIIHYSH
jgi:D-glycero-alpha-D-manno-heptose-7-phosphate kinase